MGVMEVPLLRPSTLLTAAPQMSPMLAVEVHDAHNGMPQMLPPNIGFASMHLGGHPSPLQHGMANFPWLLSGCLIGDVLMNASFSVGAGLTCSDCQSHGTDLSMVAESQPSCGAERDICLYSLEPAMT